MENVFNNDFIKAHINTIILSTLISGEKYGYEIASAIKERTNNQFELKQPTMYAALRRLEQNKFIRSNWQDSEIGGRRHYYSLTEKGIEELEKNKEVWSLSLGVVSTFFGTSVMSSDAVKQNDEIIKELDELKKSINYTETKVTETKANENILDTSLLNSQSNFLDELDNRSSDYNTNLELFKDAMEKLNRITDKEENQTQEINAVQDENTIKIINSEDSVNFVNNASQVLENDLSIFDLVEKSSKVEKEEKISDASFLSPLEFSVIEKDNKQEEPILFQEELQRELKKPSVNDAVFISNNNSLQNLDPTEIEKKQIENAFKSDDFNLEFNYVSTPLKFDSVAKKAIIEQKQFERNTLDKRYVISNSTKWANIKIPSKFYNSNKLKMLSLLLLIPFLIIGFVSTYLVAHFTETVSKNLFNSYYLCIAIFSIVFIYFLFNLYTCPNKKAIYKKNLSVLYAFITSVVLIIGIIAIFNFRHNVGLFNNVLSYLWLNPCILSFGITIYFILKQAILSSKKVKLKQIYN